MDVPTTDQLSEIVRGMQACKPETILPKKRLKHKRKVPNYFTVDQLIKLFSVMDNCRLAVMCFLAFTSGMRRAEICTIKKINIIWEEAKIKVYGKTGEDFVSIRPFVLPILKKWFRLTGDSPWLFPAHKDPQKPAHFTGFYHYYQGCLQRAGLYAGEWVTVSGVTRHCYNFHTLRHSFATYLLERNVSMEKVRVIMRHSKIQTTQIYSHVSDQSVRAAVDDTFSLRKFPGKVAVREVNNRPLSNDDPLLTLTNRLARGEISIEEFKRLKEVIEPVTAGLSSFGDRPDYLG
ncbi:MAG: tyrosine-type recombinase/integrase [Candidatus Woesearchaeota archaeon]